MTDKKSEEFDPEKHKDIKKGPLKPEHKNQYGGHPGGKDRDLAKQAEAEKKRHEK